VSAENTLILLCLEGGRDSAGASFPRRLLADQSTLTPQRGHAGRHHPFRPIGHVVYRVGWSCLDQLALSPGE